MDEPAVTILMEGLDPSLSGFVQSALRSQKPTFTSVLQEAELVYSSVQASKKRCSEVKSHLGSHLLTPVTRLHTKHTNRHPEVASSNTMGEGDGCK
jgi:hypothetical protein